jgi:site-specific DNA-methyltransferase (adenine-specific)
MEEKQKWLKGGTGTGISDRESVVSRNNHPTVKPLALMKYLIQMITPDGGVVLDPFAGSGSTLVAAKELGYDFIGIEMTEEYIPIIEARLAAVKNVQEELL